MTREEFYGGMAEIEEYLSIRGVRQAELINNVYARDNADRIEIVRRNMHYDVTIDPKGFLEDAEYARMKNLEHYASPSR